MARINWDQVGKRFYQTGVDHGVLYPQKDGAYPKGVSWSGLINITESPSGAEDNPLYADNMKYLSLKSAEELGLSITCYYYPPEWGACNGEAELIKGVRLGQQRRNTFGLCYRTKIGNDTVGEDLGYILHLVYGCSTSPSEESHNTVNESPEATEFSYDITTTPVSVSGRDADGKPFKPLSSISIKSTEIDPDKLKILEDILYGTDAASVSEDDLESPTAGTDARLPLPDELFEILSEG